MRVLMINTFHHPRGGDATYTRSLSGLLEGAGHEVIPLAMRHPDNTPSIWERRFVSWVDMRDAPDASARLRLGMRMFWSREAARACADLIAEHPPDIAHLQHIHRHLTPSVLDPLKAAGVPVIWTVHDYELICPEGHLFTRGAPCTRCKGHRYSEAVRLRCKWGRLGPSVAAALEKELHHRKRVWERVDRFLCPSAFLANKLIDFGVPAARVIHRPNFMDPGPEPPATAPGEGWLYAGRLSPEKGVDLALAAARRLPAHPLFICGTGPMEAELRQRAAELPHVHFLGHLPPSHLDRVMRSVRVVVVPSRWYENFPYAVLEAQAAGRAVVAADIGGIPEQITHGEDGLLVPPDDTDALTHAVAELLTHPARATALGKRGATRVRAHLGPAEHLDSILSIYDEVLQRRAKGAARG